MSIFVEDKTVEHDEEGEFTFSEPTQGDVMRIPKIFDTTLSEMQEQVDDEDTVDLEADYDSIDFDEMHKLLANLITDWPADKEINPENVSRMKIDILSWCMENAFEIINESQVSEDEEKN